MKFKYLLYLLIALFTVIFSGCKDKDKVEPPKVKQMTLIYAVDHNNLNPDLKTNEIQVKNALTQVAKGEYSVLIFRYINTEDYKGYGLYKLISARDANENDAVLIKRYGKERLSTDPSLLTEVINDALAVDNAEVNNLFLWGHGTGWYPYFSDHIPVVKSASPILNDEPELYSYGGEYNGSSTDWMEIHELASAIPDNKFETIWFDACYMGSIECAYELRHKSKWLVAYPTEIYTWGLPYDKVLPYLMRSRQDLAAASKALYDRYAPKYAVTVCVMDMSKINDVAESVNKIFLSGSALPEETGLQKYSRPLTNPINGNRFDPCFYDFGQYVREYAKVNGREDLYKEFASAYDKFVISKYASPFDFNDKEIKPENFSGLSIHNFKGTDSKEEQYYRMLSWFSATRR